MAACSVCTPIKNIPECTGSLVLGSISSLNTAIYIFFKNLSTGRIARQSATSAAITGIVTANLTDPESSFYNKDSTYEAWVTLQSGDPNAKQTITIGVETASCLLIEFDKIFIDSDSISNYSSITAQFE